MIACGKKLKVIPPYKIVVVRTYILDFLTHWPPVPILWFCNLNQNIGIHMWVEGNNATLPHDVLTFQCLTNWYTLNQAILITCRFRRWLNPIIAFTHMLYIYSKSRSTWRHLHLWWFKRVFIKKKVKWVGELIMLCHPKGMTIKRQVWCL